MKCLILLTCVVMFTQAYTLKDAKKDEESKDLSDPRQEIKLLAEAAGLSKADVMELIENPPATPDDVEEAILALAAKIMEQDIGGSSKGPKKGGKKGGRGSGGASTEGNAGAGSGGSSRGPKPTGSGGESRGPKPTGSGPPPTDASFERRAMGGKGGKKQGGGSGGMSGGKSGGKSGGMSGEFTPPPKGSGEGSRPPPTDSGVASFEKRKMRPAEGAEAANSVGGKKGEGKKGGKKQGAGSGGASGEFTPSPLDSGESKPPRPTGGSGERGPRPTDSDGNVLPRKDGGNGASSGAASGAASVEREDRLVRELSELLRRIARTM